jgi:hypothetical protein
VRITRRFGGVLAALALTAIAVSPALATQINQEQVPTTAAEFVALDPEQNARDCEGDTTPSGSALWHFVLNGAPSGQTVTLTADFEDAEGNPVQMTDVGEEADASGTYHFFITTPDDYTLVDANTDVDGNQLNLSHVCIGEPEVVIPESPASVLLVLTGALVGFLFLRRQSMKGGKAVAA